MTKNNISTIHECLESIAKQDYPNFDVCIIDADSRDGTATVVLEFIMKHTNFNFYDIGESTIGTARQVGVEKAKGDFIAFVDSDCELPDSSWLTKMMKPFFQKTTAVTWTMGDYKATYPSIARYTILSDRSSNGRLPTAVTARNYMPVGMGHTVVRKSVIDEVGGFKDMVAAEDIYLTKEIVNAGHSLVHVDANVYHLHATSYDSYMRKYQRNVAVTLGNISKGEEKKPNYVKFAIDNTIKPFGMCALGIVRDKDYAWLWHPVICYSKCFIAVKSMLGR